MPECAPAFNLTELDHQLLSMTDDEFVPHDWDELRDIIGQLFPLFISPSPLLAERKPLLQPRSRAYSTK